MTANTRADGEEYLRLTPRFDIRATTRSYPIRFADHALGDLSHGRFGGGAILHND